MLRDKEVKALIDETYSTFKTAANKGITHEIPEVMRQALEKNTFIFSGMKVYTSLKEAGSLSFTDKDGKAKPWNEFKKEADALNKKYNETYLRTEYDFATYSAQQADRWNQYQENSDRYDLQYRTAGDDKVRDSHAAMQGITLPADDPFWNNYFPPNGWNCRCEAIQVRKGKFEVSNSDEAIKKGNTATTSIGKNGKNNAEIFRFNPGKKGEVFPPKHAYLNPKCNKLADGGCDGKKALEEVGRLFKTVDTKKRESYMQQMSPLLKKSVTRYVGNDKHIKIGFKKSGNEHLVNDILTKPLRISKKELSKLHTLLEESEYKRSSELYKKRKDNIQRFYYFRDKERKVYYNVAEEVLKTKNGKIRLERFLYAITKTIPKK